MSRIYLASPYSGTPEQQATRYREICRISADLRRTYRNNHFFYSPIAHSHGISIHGNLKGDHQTWEHDNMVMLEWCDELWVVRLPGWVHSRGIRWEMKIAEDMGKAVKMI